jgi:hypothetical protein
MGMPVRPVQGKAGTWLEGEEFCYPKGNMTRRAYAQDPNGKNRLVWCGIPDSAFTIPCRGGGFIFSDDGTFKYHPKNKK